MDCSFQILSNVVLILVLLISSKLCILFSDHSYFLCFSLVFLNSLGLTVSSCVIILLVLSAPNNGSILFLMYQTRTFSLLFKLISHPIIPLPPFFLETYNYATSILECNSLLIVINFLIFLSISCSSFLFHLSIAAPYIIMETARVFSAIILFLLSSIIFKSNPPMKYSFLN